MVNSNNNLLWLYKSEKANGTLQVLRYIEEVSEHFLVLGVLPGLGLHRSSDDLCSYFANIFILYRVCKYANIYVCNYKQIGSVGAYLYVGGKAFSTCCCASLFTYLYSDKGSGKAV